MVHYDWSTIVTTKRNGTLTDSANSLQIYIYMLQTGLLMAIIHI